MSVRIEHANLIVRDLEASVRFLQTAFPDFRIRGEGTLFSGQRWLHVGTDETYLALSEASREPAEKWVPYAGRPGLNHLGYEVDDVVAIRERLKSAGFQESTVPNRHPARRRVYFYDPDGNDWEFVEYLSADTALRNDYDLPDL